MYLLRKLIQTIRYYCQGKGSPWRLILIWYFLLNIISILLGFFAVILSFSLTKTGVLANEILAMVICLVFVFLGLMVTFIYPFIFVYALWNCAFNVKSKPLGYIIRFLVFPFLFAHFVLSIEYFFGSKLMIYEMLDLITK